MRVIIAGGREFSDYDLLKSSCDQLFKGERIECILSGKALGADSLGEKYAKENSIRLEPYPANWSRYGKSAGPRRNAEMTRNADWLVAFWDRKSPGTQSMISLAEFAKLRINIIYY